MRTMPSMHLPWLNSVTLVGLTAVLAACAVTGTDGTRMRLRSEAFSTYVEAVFRRQDALRTEIATALDAERPDSERFLALEDAELVLLRACRGLNELAEASRDGERPRGPGALKRARQAPDCERAVEEAADLL